MRQGLERSAEAMVWTFCTLLWEVDERLLSEVNVGMHVIRADLYTFDLGSDSTFLKGTDLKLRQRR